GTVTADGRARVVHVANDEVGCLRISGLRIALDQREVLILLGTDPFDRRVQQRARFVAPLVAPPTRRAAVVDRVLVLALGSSGTVLHSLLAALLLRALHVVFEQQPFGPRCLPLRLDVRFASEG